MASTIRSLVDENVKVKDQKATALAQSFVYRQVVARPYFCINLSSLLLHKVV